MFDRDNEKSLIRQNSAYGKSRTVEVEVKKRKILKKKRTVVDERKSLSDLAHSKNMTEEEFENRMNVAKNAAKISALNKSEAIKLEEELRLSEERNKKRISEETISKEEASKEEVSKEIFSGNLNKEISLYSAKDELTKNDSLNKNPEYKKSEVGQLEEKKQEEIITKEKIIEERELKKEQLEIKVEKKENNQLEANEIATKLNIGGRESEFKNQRFHRKRFDDKLNKNTIKGEQENKKPATEESSRKILDKIDSKEEKSVVFSAYEDKKNIVKKFEKNTFEKNTFEKNTLGKPNSDAAIDNFSKEKLNRNSGQFRYKKDAQYSTATTDQRFSADRSQSANDVLSNSTDNSTNKVSVKPVLDDVPDFIPDPSIAILINEESKRKKVKVAQAQNDSKFKAKKRDDVGFKKKIIDSVDATKERSLASIRRAQEKRKQKHKPDVKSYENVVRDVVIPESISVGELASRMAVKGSDLVKSLFNLGAMVTINQSIDADIAELLCREYGHIPKRVLDSDIERDLLSEDEGNPEDYVLRPPVVTVMGHVDHGKTSLLDALRKTNVAAKEAGGITQHMGAYQVVLKSGKKITFVDTPGHEAFTQMRSRGANITDIVVLVVAADDGVMPQTIEAIHHAQAAGVPVIVAINKIDKHGANPDAVRTSLSAHGIICEDFGGDVLTLEISAKKNINIDKLEEIILLQAEMLDIKANPKIPAKGTVIDFKMEKGRGAVATVLVQSGTLRVGDVFVVGFEWGKVKALLDDSGKNIKFAGISCPVGVLGFSGNPIAGDSFIVVKSEQDAKSIAENRQKREKEKLLIASSTGGSIEQMMSQISEGNISELSLIIKADVHGSLEAISSGTSRLGTKEVSVNVIHGGVGEINESDITLASASKALIIGFNVRANVQAREAARKEKIDIRYYSIIYDVLNDVKDILSGMLSPELKEKILGQAIIRQVFGVPKIGKVAGCYVTDGIMKRGAKLRLLRDNVVIHQGDIRTLKRFKDEVKEAREGYECGINIEGYQDIKEGDVIECFEIEEIKRQI